MPKKEPAVKVLPQGQRRHIFNLHETRLVESCWNRIKLVPLAQQCLSLAPLEGGCVCVRVRMCDAHLRAGTQPSVFILLGHLRNPRLL